MCQMCEEYDANLRRMGIAMDEKVTIEFDSDTMDRLSERAHSHGRDVADEVREIVGQSLGRGAVGRRAGLLEKLRAFRSSLPPQTSDSLQLLREDRRR